MEIYRFAVVVVVAVGGEKLYDENNIQTQNKIIVQDSLEMRWHHACE